VKKKIRIVSMLLTVVLLMSAFVTPVAAGQGNGRGQERKSEQQIQYLDAEVQVINGQPELVVEAGNGNVTRVPVQLPETILVDGQILPLVARNGAVVVPTEDGPVAVPISDFDVAVVNGQVVLLAEENPFKVIAVVIVTVAVISFVRGCATRVGENVGNRIIHPVTP